MKSLITIILLFTVTIAVAQLQLPAKSEHTQNGECEKYVHDFNPALLGFFRTYVNEYYHYVGVSLHRERYDKLLNHLVNFSEVGSWKTYIKETHNRKFYITLLNDDDGNLYDILIFSGDISDPDNYIEFESPYYECKYIGTNDRLHDISNSFTSVINYKRKREVIGVVNEPRHLEFIMDDGTSIIYEFCHKNKDQYYHWGTIDTANGENAFKFEGTNKNVNCRHEHTCLILNINSEVCNH